MLADEGLLVPDWPVEYGGQDLDLASSIVIREEMWAHFEPRGAVLRPQLGRTVDLPLRHGRAAGDLHLPQISAGKVWCQGSASPTGSDLAT